jgi:hypothetical protein
LGGVVMRKIKSLIFSLIFSLAMIFGGFGVKNSVASAAGSNISYSDYSAKVQAILSEFCAYKTRSAGSETEKEASEYIRKYLILNASSLEPKNNVSCNDGVQEFSFVSNYTGVYEKSQNIVFEYKAECSKDFEEIRLMLCYFLKIYGLELRYECNGDGEKGILMSYRVKEF